MFGMMLWLVYRRRYVEVCVFIPMAFNFISLLAASPIAFAFRYVFALALMFPFMVLVPFVKNERRDDYDPVSVYNNSSI
jgi:ABC-type microcin C transport system permease subunit YejE